MLKVACRYIHFLLNGSSYCVLLIRLFTRFQAEGIFRINAENSQEEYVRNQLNQGVVPEDIDVHCLAGLIKVIPN